MSRLTKWLSAGAALAALATAAPLNAQEPAKKQAEKPQVEVVFCLDTTGSMGGLIDAAKKKIWTICNQIAAGNPTPNIKVGLVAYRDRGDEYVTKLFDLTDDLDTVYTNLMAFKAAGGGDFPESVNQALHESVTKVNWTKTKKALRIVFLVGDAPPQMNYKDDVKYTETCQLAAKRDIIINTIQCGTHNDTKKHWQDIARLAEGAYVQIDDKGGPIVVVSTPFDKELAKINLELTNGTLVYGSKGDQKKFDEVKGAQAALPPGAAADRAATYGNLRRGSSYDLLENVKNKTVKLEELKDDQLPKEMQKKTLAEKKEILQQLDKKRNELAERARDLDKQRRAFIAKQEAADAKNRARDSFDNQVLGVLQRQAQRVNIQYGAPVPMGEKKK